MPEKRNAGSPLRCDSYKLTGVVDAAVIDHDDSVHEGGHRFDRRSNMERFVPRGDHDTHAFTAIHDLSLSSRLLLRHRGVFAVRVRHLAIRGCEKRELLAFA